ncbi:class I SAM-dependent methyltransferase [Microbacterium sp. P5_E9]
MSERPIYPTWIKASRIRLFWLLAGAVLLSAVAAALLWLPALALALLAVPFAYIALVITMSSHRLSPAGDDLQAKIHRLIIDGVGENGRLLDIGCGSGELVITLAKASPDECVGLDFWPAEWGDFSQELAERNARLEGVPGIEFVHGTASQLPFAEASFARVVSSLTFHEVRDAPDKTTSVAEAIRVVAPGGRFAFVDLFDDPSFYPGREAVLAAIRMAGGEITSARALSELLALRWPMNTGKVLGHAVLVTGTKPLAR